MKKLIVLSLFSIFIVCGCSNNKEKIESEPLTIENTNTEETFKDNPEIEMTKEEEKENIEITTKKMYVSAKNGLNIREFASADSNIIDTVPANTELDVVEGFYIGDWVRVLYNEKECYVNSKYLSETKVGENKLNSYLGTYKITHYCPCSQCCGWSTGITASGTYATAGRTVACNSLPFGTQIMINGNIYTVEDTGGMSNSTIDIFVGSHQEALNKGVYYADVYLAN